MPAVAAIAEQRVLLSNVSWETYERLLSERVNSPGTRFAYDEGDLEIMTVYIGHEGPNAVLELIVNVVAEELGIDWFSSRSTTFKRKDIEKGFEPDSSFYFAAAPKMRGKSKLDLPADPPPDLTIEVDITRSSLNRFRIFAGIGVGEVWRYDGERVVIYRLDADQYQQSAASLVLPPVTGELLTEYLNAAENETRPQWIRRLREWVRSQLP